MPKSRRPQKHRRPSERRAGATPSKRRAGPRAPRPPARPHAEGSDAVLTKPLSESIRSGHPWVFADAVALPEAARTGDAVRLVDADGAFVAWGTVDRDTPLAFRAWSVREDQPITDALLFDRLGQARALRADVIPSGVTGYRVCHGENDGIPGLHLDWYDGVASLRTDGPLGRAWEDRFVRAAQQVLKPEAVVVRNRDVEGGKARLVAGQLEGERVIAEGDRRFWVDILHGQKTGFFLDQRDNRTRVGALAAGRRVLNVFAYTGGFSVAAALGGATRVTTVDIAAPAVDTAARSFALNGLDPAAHAFIAADAFDVLAELEPRAPDAPDLIVLDPPSFVRNRASMERGVRAYKKLNEMALRGLPPGGWLCTASCSSHIDDERFLAIVRDSVATVGRRATIAGRFGAGLDHPERPGFPQGNYLQFVMVRVD